MTTLEAVNEIIAGLGEPPVAALDTGGTSLIAEAETYLNTSNRRIQAQGWPYNIEAEYELAVSTIKLGFTGSAGTFVFDETVTQSGSGATGKFSYIEGAFMYLRPIAGTFAGSGTLTGGMSGATRTTASYAAQTASKMPVSSSWLAVRPFSIEGEAQELRRFVQRGSFFYDDVEKTYDFSVALRLDATILLSFTDLPFALSEYVVRHAAMRFQAYKKRGVIDQSFIDQQTRVERFAARREARDHRPVNVLRTFEVRAVKGHRVPIVYP